MGADAIRDALVASDRLKYTATDEALLSIQNIAEALANGGTTQAQGLSVYSRILDTLNPAVRSQMHLLKINKIREGMGMEPISKADGATFTKKLTELFEDVSKKNSELDKLAVAQDKSPNPGKMVQEIADAQRAVERANGEIMRHVDTVAPGKGKLERFANAQR